MDKTPTEEHPTEKQPAVLSGVAEHPHSIIDAVVERRMAMLEQARARKTQAAPSPTQDLTAGLWAMIPKNQRPLVVIAILIFTGGSGSWLLNLSAIWSLPREVAAIKMQLNEQGEQLKEIKALFQGSTSRPQ